MANTYRNLVGEPEEERPHRRPRRKWEDNIKWILEKLGCWLQNGFTWLRDQWRALVKMARNLRFK
jgi:hypothetical protein